MFKPIKKWYNYIIFYQIIASIFFVMAAIEYSAKIMDKITEISFGKFFYWEYIYINFGGDVFVSIITIAIILTIFLLRPLSILLFAIRKTLKICQSIRTFKEDIKQFIKIVFVSPQIGINFLKQIAFVMLGLCLFMVIFAVIMHMMGNLLPKAMEFIEINIESWMFYALSVAFLILNVLRSLYVVVSDARALAKAKKLELTRTQIGKCFLGFSYSYCRLKYVRWLEANCNQAPEDPWPDGRPNLVNDKASSELLAQLDERWLGLEQ